MVGVHTDRRGYSLLSATNTATGSGMDLRHTPSMFAYSFVTGGSAIISIETTHSLESDAAWMPVVTFTATNGTTATAAYTTNWMWARGHSSGYVGATASVFIAGGAR